MKKIPQRTCLGCGQQKDKSALIRVVRTPEGQYLLDESGRKNGRGAYICKDAACLKNAVKKKALARSFQENIPDEVYEALVKEIEQLDK